MAKFDPEKDHGEIAGVFFEYPNARYIQNGVYFTASGDEAQPATAEQVGAREQDLQSENASLDEARAKDEERKARERDRKRRARAAARAKKAKTGSGNAAAA